MTTASQGAKLIWGASDDHFNDKTLMVALAMRHFDWIFTRHGKTAIELRRTGRSAWHRSKTVSRVNHGTS